jgi:hypothetical protein
MIMHPCPFSVMLSALLLGSVAAAGEPSSRPQGVDLGKPVLWGAECALPEGSGLAFGGNEQAADDGCARTKVREGGAWKPIFEELRAKNSLQKQHDKAWELRTRLKNALSRARFAFFQGMAAAEEQKLLKAEEIGRAHV